jgi:hypothetical protein
MRRPKTLEGAEVCCLEHWVGCCCSAACFLVCPVRGALKGGTGTESETDDWAFDGCGCVVSGIVAAASGN